MQERQAESQGQHVVLKRPAVIIATLSAVFLCALVLSSGLSTSEFSGYEENELEISGSKMDSLRSGSKLKQVDQYDSIQVW